MIKLTLFEYVIIAVYLVFVLLLGLWNGRNVKNLNANMALPAVVGTVLPVGLRALVVAAIISVVMSSADSLWQAGDYAREFD